ncbi:MAG: Rieske 2Fe-2S domain-containing protein [Acidimicrobiales bacterium]|nr:Rieske 2Fe-2S domain-containing protein [Acidimicrobiales bacterium]
MSKSLTNLWHPIASAEDLPYRHIFQGQLLGRELAVWRADDDFVNIWENRCLHRGVRLSIGRNEGLELKCQYHGWRYANRSAGCTYIPAHPADAPARTICNRTFPVCERYGLIWSGEDPTGDPPEISLLEKGRTLPLRSIAVNASLNLVLEHLANYRFSLNGDPGNLAVTTADYLDQCSLSVTATCDSKQSTVLFFVQPVDSNRSVIRGVLCSSPTDSERLLTLRHHSTELSHLREKVELDALKAPLIQPMTPTIEQVPITSYEIMMPSSGRKASLRVQVLRKWVTAEGIVGLELESIGKPLPTPQPGAHIDVHLPNGLVRQYSLTNAPGQGSLYRLGVKLESDSRGGSSCLHETVKEGDVLAISEPRNNFSLRRDAVKTLLVAGGIGVTPLLSMAHTLRNNKLDYELHYFAQTDGHLAFPEVLQEFGDAVVLHLGLSPEATSKELTALLLGYKSAMHVYVCGPGPMLEAARRIASEEGWPDTAVHFEYFRNTIEIDSSSSFEVSLARSALTLEIPSGKTILEILRANGITLMSSCEQGACGTCEVPVVEGDPEHQDVYLNDSEKAAGQRIMTCVSRAKSPRLVLDI